MGFFSSSKDEKSVEELEQDIREKETELQKIEGERRAENLRKSKKQELAEKEKKLKNEEFKQTKAGKVIDTLGTELGKLAEATDSEKAAELAKSAEKVDGDGKNDSRNALGIGLEDPTDKARDIEVEGDLQVEGDVVTEDNGSQGLDFMTEDDDNSTGIF